MRGIKQYLLVVGVALVRVEEVAGVLDDWVEMIWSVLVEPPKRPLMKLLTGSCVVVAACVAAPLALLLPLPLPFPLPLLFVLPFPLFPPPA